MEIKTTYKSKIVFNGREYANADEMPEDVRRLYRNAMALVAKGGPSVKRVSKTRFVFNGKEYNSADEIPLDVRCEPAPFSADRLRQRASVAAIVRVTRIRVGASNPQLVLVENELFS